MSDTQIKLTAPDHPNGYKYLWNDTAIEERIAQGTVPEKVAE
jgi:hypothetical protein